MLPIELRSPKEVAHDLADRVRSLRLERQWTQQEMAQRAGVTLATYRRFEISGLISLERLLKIALVLDALHQFEDLFRLPPPTTLSDLDKGRARSRGKRRDAKT